MNKLIEQTACPQCSKTGKGKSLAVYTDGVYCHECGYRDAEPKGEGPKSIFLKGSYPDVLGNRKITKETLEHFEYQVGTYSGFMDGEEVRNEPVHIQNIRDKAGHLVAQQLRASGKRFKFIGNSSGLGLVGTHLYQPNENVFVTVVEGAIDQLSVAQACGNQFPVLTVPAGAKSAYKAIQADLEYLNGFKYVVLAFDNDEAGQKATEDCIGLFTPGKVRVAVWPSKDANEMLVQGQYAAIKSVLFNASARRPESIIELSDISLEEIRKIEIRGADLPFPVLNRKLRGLKKSCLYTLVAREKAGKSLVTKEIVLKLIEQGHTVGMLYLEETASKAATSFLAMERNIPMWQVEEHLDVLGGAEAIKHSLISFKNRGLYIYNHMGAIDVDSIMSAITYMVKALKLDYIVVDNISVALPGGKPGTDERTQIGNFVYNCVSLVNNSDTTILNVAHLTKNRKDKDGEDSEVITRADIYGSGAFAKFSYAVIGLERRKETAESYLKVLADRGRGQEGYADKLSYDINTGRLSSVEDVV